MRILVVEERTGLTGRVWCVVSLAARGSDLEWRVVRGAPFQITLLTFRDVFVRMFFWTLLLYPVILVVGFGTVLLEKVVPDYPKLGFATRFFGNVLQIVSQVFYDYEWKRLIALTMLIIPALAFVMIVALVMFIRLVRSSTTLFASQFRQRETLRLTVIAALVTAIDPTNH